MTAKADYIAARASESLSYGDLAYAQEQGWCGSSPDGMGPHVPWEGACAECGATIYCAECGEPLTVEGDNDPAMHADPQHVFCDICGEAEHPAEMTTDWNGETGSHLSCKKQEGV